jgi:hypothetical protein
VQRRIGEAVLVKDHFEGTPTFVMPELDTSHVEWCPPELAGGLLIGREREEGLPDQRTGD